MTTDLDDRGSFAELYTGAGMGPESARKHAWGFGWWWLVVVGVVGLVVTLGYLAGDETQTDTQFDQTHHSLAVTDQHLGQLRSELVAARRELAAVKSGVAADSSAVARDTSDLRGVEMALDNAQTNVTHQTSTIGDLTTCLGGVEQALNALAVADQGEAIAALDAVTTSCAKAVASSD